MARRRVAEKREAGLDPKYGDAAVTKFINCMMKAGKRSVAERIFYNAMDVIHDKTGEDPIEVFRQALRNVQPTVEVKSRRVGGSTYQVPIEVRPARRAALARRWLIMFARQRPDKSMHERLAKELMDAANKAGATMRRRDETHRMAEANKAFSHYRW
ncbi:MAG: 30S ribosomal protein S7 [Nitrospirota bacterium]|jgi:small subunit ribosomal protein S7